MAFSGKKIGTEVLAAISQLYFILLSTFLSIGRQQLSLFDVNYALMATSSPFTIHLAFSSICNLFGLRVGLSKEIEPYRRIVFSFGALLLPLWFGLGLTLRLSSKAFKDSELCSDPTFRDLIFEPLLFIIPLTGPVGVIWAVLPSFIAGFLTWGIITLFAVVVGFLVRCGRAPGLKQALHKAYMEIKSVGSIFVILGALSNRI